jgi:hypothetical protein
MNYGAQCEVDVSIDPNTGDHWTEEYIEALPREDNRIEKKSSRCDNWSDDELREELAKQLSAFANTGGGSLIFGVDNTGKIDGGLRQTRRGRQSTKEWLEDIIPHCTDPEIIGCRVVDLQHSSDSPHIGIDKSVFVVEIPDSERAPHQSAPDRRYYVRLGSKSLPASHRLVEDIRNRAIHPRVIVESMEIVKATFEGGAGNDASGKFRTILRISISNDGSIRAQNTCLRLSSTARLELSLPVPMGIDPRSGGKKGTEVLLEFRDILYPHMQLEVEIALMFGARLIPLSHVIPTIPTKFEIAIGDGAWRDVILTAAIYADNAAQFQKQFTLGQTDPHSEVDKLLQAYKAAFLKKRLQDSSSPPTSSWMS